MDAEDTCEAAHASLAGTPLEDTPAEDGFSFTGFGSSPDDTEWWDDDFFDDDSERFDQYTERTDSPCPFGSPTTSFAPDESLLQDDLDLNESDDSPRGRSNSIDFDLSSAVQEDVIELNALRMVRQYVKSVAALTEQKTEGFRKILGDKAATQRRKIESRMQTLEKQLKESFDGAPLREAASGLRQRVSKNIEHEVSGLKSRMRDQVERTQDQMKTRYRKYAPKWRKMITGNEHTRVRMHLRQPQVVRLMDRVSFFVSVNLMMFAQYYLIVHPEHFKYYYCVGWAILFPVRAFMYYNLSYLFFMLDFCYFVQPLLLAMCFVLPGSKVLFYTNYAFATGPLSVAIVLWRNSLVFHDVDKVTSVFIHIMPPLLMHCVKWSDPTYATAAFVLTGVADWILHLLVYPLAVYMAWQIGYLFLTEIVFRRFLASRPEQQTSLRWLGTDTRFFMYKLCTTVFKDRLGFLGPDEHLSDLSIKSLFIFVFTQLVFTFFTLIPPMFLYSFQTGNVVWLCILFMCVTWNGASFYIEVFSRRYAPTAFATRVPLSKSVSVDNVATKEGANPEGVWNADSKLK